jgi:hypothetical protein
LMIETPADYRSFAFSEKLRSVRATLSGLASLCSTFSLESGVLFFVIARNEAISSFLFFGVTHRKNFGSGFRLYLSVTLRGYHLK